MISLILFIFISGRECNGLSLSRIGILGGGKADLPSEAGGVSQ